MAATFVVKDCDAAVLNAFLNSMHKSTKEKDDPYGYIGSLWQQLTKEGVQPSLVDTTDPLSSVDLEKVVRLFRSYESTELLVPTECVRNAYKRNSKPYILVRYQPTENMKVVSEASAHKLMKANIENFPSVENRYLMFRFSLPGYDVKKQSALIYFDFMDGGTHNGGGGWALLSKVKGKWTLSWCQLGMRG